MAAEWHYTKDGKQHGPVSASELKAFASSGTLVPTDMVRKEGMAEWKQAGKINGLFSPTSVPATNSPKVPPDIPQIKVPPTLPKTALKQSLVEAAKEAAQYAGKQTERTKLINLTLPPLYQALGRHAFTSPDFRAEFAEVFQQLDQVQADQSEIKSRTPVTAKSFGDKAKAMAGQAMDAAHSQKLSLRQTSLFGSLGKSVYEKHKEQSGPKELVKPIAESLARLATLDSELNALSAPKDGSLITPKRIVIASAAACALLVIVILKSGGVATISATSTGIESTKSENAKSDFSKASESPLDFSSLDYSKGPNGEIIEEFYDADATHCGFIPGNPPTPDDLKWRGLRQPALRKSIVDKTFVFHGVQIVWSKKPVVPKENVEIQVKREGKEPPSYNMDGGVRYRVWHLWNGKKHGPEQLFDKSGVTVLAEAVFVDGQMHGPDIAYWPTGKMKIKQFWKNGKLHGNYTKWFEGGQTAETSTFANNLQEGVWTTYYLNGKKEKEATFEKGKVVGIVKEWDDKGNDVTVDLSGTLAKGGGYTERILSLHPNVLRKFGSFKHISKNNHKPRYQSGTVGDLLQAMSLLSPITGLPVTNGNRLYGKYSSICGNPVIPLVLWEQVFLSPEDTAVEEDFVDTMWTFNCTDGTVRMFGLTNNGVRISTLWWDQYNKEFCIAE